MIDIGLFDYSKSFNFVLEDFIDLQILFVRVFLFLEISGGKGKKWVYCFDF